MEPDQDQIEAHDVGKCLSDCPICEQERGMAEYYAEGEADYRLHMMQDDRGPDED